MAFSSRRSSSNQPEDNLAVVERVVRRNFAVGQRFTAAQICAIFRKDVWSTTMGKKKVRAALRQLVADGKLQQFPVYSYRGFRRHRTGKGMGRKQNGYEFAIRK